MEFLKEILHNEMLVCPALAWATAQVIKAIINLITTKEFSFERLIGSGGMPSSHSATVCALVTATIINCGVSSFECAISCIFAFIVMYDAMNVRMETGKQSKFLNFWLNTEEMQAKLAEAGVEKWAEIIFKEYVGHTPLQVSVGAILGVALALGMCFYVIV